ncbi:MAG: dynamin family protein [Gordonia sp. (in: high G+C Gram-positive bacteria)]|uniref:dynamin family protein n=1 Tax=Gordonia sp. (in: high G+C Gram-positive bacteria) TaxID=84139 RepID=UPI003BB6E6E9
MVYQGAALRTAVRAMLDDVARIGPEEHAAVAALRTELAPGHSTVALAGRVSSGKSTLVNALVTEDIAPTDRSECTMVATMYAFGTPARREVVALDGDHAAVSGHTRELGRAVDEVDYELVYLSQAHLRDRYRIIDTPGLSSTTEASENATRRALIDRGGLPAPDIQLFLVEGGHLRTDEVAFLREAGASRLNTILVVAHADNAGAGADGTGDPFDTAEALAQNLAAAHPDLTRTVIPVSGLMAEAAEVGVSERDAAALARLIDADADELEMDLFTETDRTLVDLAAKLGIYTVLHGREAATQGAVALSEWLLQRSGLQRLRQAIDAQLGGYTEVATARAALAGVREIARTSASPHQVESAMERFEIDPATGSLQVAAALEQVMRRAPESPLIADLDRVFWAPDGARACGLPRGTPFGRVQQRAGELLAECRIRRLTLMLGAEREALTVLERSYQMASSGAVPRAARPSGR